MKNVKKMVAYAEREPMNPEKIKHLRGRRDRHMEGGWRSNCMSRRRRNKGKGKVDGRIIRQRRDFLRTFGLAVSTEFGHCGF
jgi:hypothetical protein